MKYYLIAGEASGDLHAAHLMSAIRSHDPESEFRFLGGEQMQAVGGTLVRHYRELAYMGIIPVITHLPTILRGMRDCKRDIQNWQPDVLILVDYPGFNLSIAKYVRCHAPKIKIYYYIPPKIWAWKERRIKQLRSYTDHLLSILPFEVDYYQHRHGFTNVTYVGNPTLDEVMAFERANPRDFSQFIAENNLDQRPIIALLAGSRRQEIKDNLHRMLKAVQPLADRYQFVIAAAPNIEESYYFQWMGNIPARLLYGQTYRILQHSSAALVTSGTATLETALFRVPQVVCYYINMGKLFSFLRRHVLKVPYISLVNLVANLEVVPELVADGMTVENVRNHLLRILPDGADRKTMLQGYDEVAQRLGDVGAPQRAAAFIV